MRRFLQVHTFYSHYLQQFYGRFPELAQQPYAFQNKALLYDFFGGVHMIAPYLQKMGYISHLIIANCAPAQRQWARERGLPRDNHLSATELLLHQIQEVDPDILYFGDPITFDSKFVRLLPRRPRLVMGWRASMIPKGTDWSEFDIILSNMAHVQTAARLFGAKATEEFYPGMPTWVIRKCSVVPKKLDIGFCGQYTRGQHEERNYYLDIVAQMAAQYGFSCALHLSGQIHLVTPAIKRVLASPVYGMAMQEVLAASRIAFDGRGKIFTYDPVSSQEIDLGQKTTGNMRIFEATGSGAFLLTPEFDNLKDCFVPGQEVETYASEAELVDKIRYYLKHAEAREAIAERGKARCLRDHTMEKRIQELDRIINKYHP